MERKLVWLEVMRGFAALWVLAHHAELSTSAFFGEISSTFIARGYLGVDFFFILSGFIIALSSQRMVEGGRGFGEYFALRLSRIYGAYLPVGLVLFFSYQFFPELSLSGRQVGALASATLFPTDLPPALSVAWTLQHELLFYLIFSFFFISKRVGATVLAFWLGFIVISWLGGGEYNSPVFNLISHPLNLWFFVGIGVFLVKKFEVLPVLFLVAVVALFLTMYVLTEMNLSRVFIGFVFAILVLLFSRVRNISFSPPYILIYLGAASYSIYLVHNPVQSVISRIIPFVVDDANPWLAFFVISFLSLVAGALYYSFFEAHVISFFKRIIKSRFLIRSNIHKATFEQ